MFSEAAMLWTLLREEEQRRLRQEDALPCQTDGCGHQGTAGAPEPEGTLQVVPNTV